MKNKNMKTKNRVGFLLAGALAAFTIGAALPAAAQNGAAKGPGLVTIPVTVHPQDDRSREAAARLQPGDFVVTEDGQRQQIVSVRRATEAPDEVAVVIQDNLVQGVGNEIKGLKQFIGGLPAGSRVMTGYLSTGGFRVAQDFTDDRGRAADSLRIPTGSDANAPTYLYSAVVDVIKRFDSQPADARRFILLVSDGLDLGRGFESASPMQALDLERAIREAQRRGIAVYTFYAPTEVTSRGRLATNYGQGSLNRLADETGGDAFFSGTSFVTFDPYYRELNDELSRTWLVTYRSTSTKKGFRDVHVSTESDIHLHYPDGYTVKD